MTARAYLNPYAAGVALGLVLLACFVLTGQGLGAVGAFANAASSVVEHVVPRHSNAFFDSYAQDGTAWIVAEVIGVIIGGGMSALVCGRFRIELVRGPQAGVGKRLLACICGGALMGCGAVLARGCTSGQALSGGALLSVGSWAFMATVFAAAYLSMPFLRRLWL